MRYFWSTPHRFACRDDKLGLIGVVICVGLFVLAALFHI